MGKNFGPIPNGDGDIRRIDTLPTDVEEGECENAGKLQSRPLMRVIAVVATEVAVAMRPSASHDRSLSFRTSLRDGSGS